MSTEAYDASFFENQAASSLSSARVVLDRVFHLLQPRRVLDVGCGVGTWLRAAIDLGATEVIGTDGAYVDPASLLIERDRFLPADLATQTLADVLGPRAAIPFDLIICLEVAEHLAHERGPSLVAELTRLGDVVLFSAAVPFQYGTNHVNEQWPEYWSILFRAHGFECFDPLRAEIWNHPDVDWWYAQNTLLFVRAGAVAASALPAQSRVGSRGLSRVHPNNLLSNLLGLPRRYRLAAAQEEFNDYHSLVAADRQGDTAVPVLAAPARAATGAPQGRDVFPWTRMETYHPEREIADLAEEAAKLRQEAADLRQQAADLSQTLGETGAWLHAANQAFAAEREARHAMEARARDAERYQQQMQAHAAARLQAETRLADGQRDQAEQRKAWEAELLALRAELAGERQELQARFANAEQELHERATELGRRGAELEAHMAQVDAVRRSRLWRAARRTRSIGGRLARLTTRTRPHAPAPSVDQSEPLPPEEAVVESALETASPPEKPQIKCYERVFGEVNWWTLAAAVTRLKRLEVFDGEDYLRRNPDVAAAGLDPYAHFIQSGALEGRGRVDPEDLARVMSGLSLFDNAVRALPPQMHDDSDLASLVRDVNHIGIFVSTHGNVFMDDLANDLAADLRTAGVKVDILDETADIETRPTTCLFVAPHEFFILGQGSDWVRDDVLSEAFMFGTEQVQTSWFNLSLPFILMSRGIVDICAQTADLFERLDMASLHVLPGVRHRPSPLTERDRRHSLYGVLPAAAQRDIDPGLAFADRPIDISFFGTSSPRRDRFFARNAAFFAEYETFNYNRRPGRGPIRSQGEDGALTRLAGHVSGHSKITLNIHREEFGYFEWHRMVRLGMCTGSLVVSDPCLPHPDFIANEHFLQENARHIPDLLEWLLRTDEGAREAERVRANVDRLISNSLGTTRAVASMLRFFAQHRSRERG